MRGILRLPPCLTVFHPWHRVQWSPARPPRVRLFGCPTLGEGGDSQMCHDAWALGCSRAVTKASTAPGRIRSFLPKRRAGRSPFATKSYTVLTFRLSRAATSCALKSRSSMRDAPFYCVPTHDDTTTHAPSTVSHLLRGVVNSPPVTVSRRVLLRPSL